MSYIFPSSLPVSSFSYVFLSLVCWLSFIGLSRCGRLVVLNACINGWWSISAVLSMIVLRYCCGHGIWDTGLEWIREMGRTNTKKDARTSLNYILGKHFVCTRSSHLYSRLLSIFFVSIPPHGPIPWVQLTSLSSTNTSCLNSHAYLALTLLYPSRTSPPACVYFSSNVNRWQLS
jgi:hypothetical protein